MIWSSLGSVVASLVLAAVQAPAQPFDLDSKLINVPDSSWNVYGPDQTSKRLESGGPKGYPAYEVTVTGVGRNAWDAGAVSPIPKPIGSGDVILVAVYLRNPNLPAGQTESLPLIGATGASAPYPAIAGAPAGVTSEWKVFFASGKSPQAFP